MSLNISGSTKDKQELSVLQQDQPIEMEHSQKQKQQNNIQQLQLGPPLKQQNTYKEKQEILISALNNNESFKSDNDYVFEQQSPVPLVQMNQSNNSGKALNKFTFGKAHELAFGSLVKEQNQNQGYSILPQEYEFKERSSQLFSQVSMSNQSFHIPTIMKQQQQHNYGEVYRGSEFTTKDSRPEYFTIKVNLFVQQEHETYSLLLSIPSAYRVQDAIVHCLEHFNHKLHNYRLKMVPDYFALVKEGQDGRADSQAPILHPNQNLYETGINNFCLCIKNSETKVLVKRKNTTEQLNMKQPTITEQSENKFEMQIPLGTKQQEPKTSQQKGEQGVAECVKSLLNCFWIRNTNGVVGATQTNEDDENLFRLSKKDKNEYKKLNKKYNTDSFDEDYRYSSALLDIKK